MSEVINQIDELKRKLIIAGRKAVEELIKVAEESIITNDETDLTADKLKNAAQAKRIAIEDAFAILQRISDEENAMSEDKGNSAVNDTKGFAERFSK